MITEKEVACGIKSGDVFEQRTVLGNAFRIGTSKGGSPIWAFMVQCSCGSIDRARAADLRNNRSRRCKSCQYVRVGNSSRTHGESTTKFYRLWAGMLARCYCPLHKSYRDYGGSGIKVWEEWWTYLPFKTWALANGYEEGKQIHRIENALIYSPDTCEWLTDDEHRAKHVEMRRNK